MPAGEHSGAHPDAASPGDRRRPARTGVASFVRLATIFSLTALCASRASLVVHELGGHAGMALALGGSIDRFFLYVFGGGFVRPVRQPPFSLGGALAVALAGVALELVLGAVCLWLAARLRGRPLLHLVLYAWGFVDVIHALYYTAAGTFHGYGDFALLHVALGAGRALVVVAATLALAAATVAFGRGLARRVRPYFAHRGAAAQIALAAAAVGCAGLVHLGLTRAELAMSPKPEYARVLQDEAARRVARALDAYAAELRAHGETPDPEALAARRRALEAAERRFPFAPALAIGVALAAGLGACVRRPQIAGEATPVPSFRRIAPLAVATLAALALVLALRLFARTAPPPARGANGERDGRACAHDRAPCAHGASTGSAPGMGGDHARMRPAGVRAWALLS